MIPFPMTNRLNVTNQNMGTSCYSSTSCQLEKERLEKNKKILDRDISLTRLQNTLEKLKKYSEKSGIPYLEVLEAFLTEEQVELYNNRFTIREEATKLREEEALEAERIKKELDNYQKIADDYRENTYPTTIPSNPDVGDFNIHYYADCQNQIDRSGFHRISPNIKSNSKSVFYQRLTEIIN
jgi:hypothetical protein